MNSHAGDAARLFEAGIGPGAARVAGFVDSIAVGSVAADAGFAHPGINDVGIRRRHRDRSDGSGIYESIRDVAPAYAAVFGFPDSAAGGAEIEIQLVDGIACDGR